MTQTLREFARSFTALANQGNFGGNEVKKQVVIAVVRNLVNVTPVDTSQALSNWIVAVGSKSYARIQPYAFGQRGSTQEISAAYAVAEAMKVLENVKPGQAVYISNNLPYIRKLNDGSSTQEPANFVARAELIGRKVAAAASKGQKSV